MRAFNRVLSLLLGLALLAGGLLVAAEVAAGLLGRGALVIPARRWADALRATTFTDPAARVVFAVVAVVGLVLFVVEARRWPKRRVPLADDQQRAWWLLRRSLEQHLGRAVTTGTGATGARARVRPQRRRLRVRLDADVAPAARPAVEQHAAKVLEQLIGPDRSQIRVRIRRRDRVA
jgi:hypothetical protein